MEYKRQLPFAERTLYVSRASLSGACVDGTRFVVHTSIQLFRPVPQAHDVKEFLNESDDVVKFVSLSFSLALLGPYDVVNFSVKLGSQTDVINSQQTCDIY